MNTWAEFKPVFYDELIQKGLIENKKFLEQKIEETKSLMKENRAGELIDNPKSAGSQGSPRKEFPGAK